MATKTAEKKVRAAYREHSNVSIYAPQNNTNRLVLEVWKEECQSAAGKKACDALVKELPVLTAASTIAQAASRVRGSKGCPKNALARKDLYPKRSYGPVHTQHALDVYDYDDATTKYLKDRMKEQKRRAACIKKCVEQCMLDTE